MQLEAEGIGIKCRNSLIALPEFGTRIVLLTFAVREIPPETLSELLTVLPSLNTRQSECGNCSLCMKACPTGAISENGLTTERCMRLQMETAQHPDSVRAMQKTFIGCEICQYACPRNAKIPPADTESFRAANGDEINLNDVFNLKRLITGDAAQARSLVGRNFTGNGKLTAEAIAFAANDSELFCLYAMRYLRQPTRLSMPCAMPCVMPQQSKKSAVHASDAVSRTIWDWF